MFFTCEINIFLSFFLSKGGYRTTDEPFPRGEIIVTGGSICKGYFKRPKETSETFYYDKNGYYCFKSGDIGEIDEHGCIKIIDRMKDLVKLKHGEFISLGNIESIVKTLPLVETACAYADSSRSKVVVILVPAPEILDELYRDEGVQKGEKSANSYTLDSGEINKRVLSIIQKHCRDCGMLYFQMY